jgi:hypothetical protein
VKKKATKRTEKQAQGYVLPVGKSLGLRTCNSDMSSASEHANGFKWPKSGLVECPDWKQTKECGHGLHLLPSGEGKGELLDFSSAAKWLVVEYTSADAIDLNGKIKIPRGLVVFCGDRKGATDFIALYCKSARSIVGGTSTSGDEGTSTSGYRGTSTSGYRGTSTSGDEGTSTSGDEGTSTSGDEGTSKSGDVGIVVCRWWDGGKGRYRLSVGYVGEDGIKANAFYRADETGKLVEVKP